MGPPQSIAHYRIVSKLGEGGMGAVYRATDTKLNRDVAIKVLPDSFAQDPDRLARFTREAQVLAALNHPNIAAIYGVEDRALVMELVEGEELQCPLPIETAIAYARQIAEGVEAAHEKGIVHRDLKPANIKVTPSGQVKVLDFGLAAVTQGSAIASASPENSPTLTFMAGSQAGIILGTASYMSPEQAAGKPVDKRADIWSFGVVLFEMLTGKRLFLGETVSHTLAGVLQGSIDFDALPSQTPAAVRMLLKRCLDRNLRTRLRDIGEARIALENTSPEPVSPRATSLIPWMVAAAFALLALLSGLRAWVSGPGPAASPVRSTLELAPAGQLFAGLSGRPYSPEIVFSPGGKTLVFTGSGGANGPGTRAPQLYKRSLDQNEAVAIPGTTGATTPFFSPDGQWLAFFSAGELKKVSINGGPPVTICRPPDGLPYGGTWGAGNTIAFVKTSLLQVSADGGTPETLLSRDETTGAVFSAPEFLPDGKSLLFTRRNTYWDEAEIDVLTPGGKPRPLIKGANPRYIPGYLIFLRMGTLLAVPFDAAKVQVSGSPVPLLEGVMQNVGGPGTFADSGVGQFAVASSGALLYASGGIYPPRTGSVVRMDRKGEITDLNIHEAMATARLSPDGQRVAAAIWNSNVRARDARIYDLVRGTVTLLTRDKDGQAPVWSPDGARVALVNGQHSLLVARADGQGSLETVVPGNPSMLTSPMAWSPDGKWLMYLALSPKNQLLAKAMDGSPAEPLALTDSLAYDGDFSPDGKWISYDVGAPPGQEGIYLQAFPGPGEKIRIVPGAAMNPAWARNGRELFYLARGSSGSPFGSMMAVDIQLGDHPRIGTPHELFPLQEGFGSRDPGRGYDVYSDGHFLVPLATSPKDPPATSLHLVTNWIDEVKRRVSGSKQ